MQANKNIYDTHDELIVQRYWNGVRLVKPMVDSDTFAINSIRTIFRSSLNAYFLDTNSIIRNINENTIISCGFHSVKDTIGKTVAIAAKKETAEFEFMHDNNVVTRNQIIMREEHFIRLDESESFYLNTKLPWYNQENKVIGIFGFSFLLDSQNVANQSSVQLSDHLMFLLNSGLLSSNAIRFNQDLVSNFLPGKTVGNVYLSKRQTEILKYVILGHTAKQIAQILGLSFRTVEYYLVNIKKKFNVKSKSELINKLMLLS